MNRSRGFTLLELLLASALCVMLMVGVLGVVATLAPSEHEREIGPDGEGQLHGEVVDAVTRLLADDLRHAFEVTAPRPSELVFVGQGAMDGDGRGFTHRPVRVKYLVEEIDGRRWLVRRQASLDVLTNQNVQRDLVCSGVTKFELTKVVNVSGGTRETVVPEGGSAGSDSGDGTTLAADAAVQGATDRQRDSVRVNGLWYYREYAPKWALEEMSTNTWARRGVAREEAEAETEAGTEVAEPAQDDIVRAGGGSVWRLRLWTDDSDQPAIERLVMVEWSDRK